MDDGAEFFAGDGDMTACPAATMPGVLGGEPVVTIDWSGAGIYAR